VKVLRAFWRDSRAAVYAVAFAAATASYGLVHAHGFPKSNADWTLVGWAALAAALGAAGRYVDPLIAGLARRAGSAAVGGRSLVTQAQIEAIVQDELAKAQTEATAKMAAPDGPQ
jgi:hypothetical protein